MRFIDNGDHVLLNTTVPTHFTLSNQIQWSLLDLTIVSANIASKCNTKVTQDFLGSDHSVILTTIQGFDAPTKLQIPRWNFHRADWPAFTSECLHQITDQTISKNTYRFADQVTEALLAVATATIPQTKPYRINPVPWWNKQCTVAIRNRKHAFNRMMRTRHPQDIITFKRTRAITRKTILQAKKKKLEALLRVNKQQRQTFNSLENIKKVFWPKLQYLHFSTKKWHWFCKNRS